MSLESNLTDAIAAQNTLTQTVAAKMRAIDAQITGFIDAWGVNGYTTLEVGAGKPYASISDAWNSLAGKALRADVLIKVDDGVYNTSGIWISGHPYASRVRIIGNIANPSACVIKMTPDANKQSHGVMFNNVRGIEFSGFKIVGEVTAANVAHRGLLVSEKSIVRCAKNSLIVEGGLRGVQIVSGSSLEAPGAIVNGVWYWAVEAYTNSTAHMPSLKVNGNGRDVTLAFPNTAVWPDGGTISSHGVRVADGSLFAGDHCSVSNVVYGYNAVSNSYIWCDGSKADTCVHGFEAAHGAILWNYNWDVKPSNPTASWGEATNCYVGFRALFSSQVIAPKSRAKNCRDHGYSADRLGNIDAPYSGATGCGTGYWASAGSLIYAHGASATTSGNTTNFSPSSSSVLGNNNAQIIFS